MLVMGRAARRAVDAAVAAVADEAGLAGPSLPVRPALRPVLRPVWPGVRAAGVRLAGVRLLCTS